MSNTPENQYGNTASGELEHDIMLLLKRFSVEPYGRQIFMVARKSKFKTDCNSDLWLRFENGTLQSLHADISDDREPYITTIYLTSEPDGFKAIESLTPCTPSASIPDDTTINSRIIQTEVLDYVQYDRLGGVIDDVEELIDGDVHDPAFERIVLAGSYMEMRRHSPTKWQQRLNKARRSAGFVMASLNQVDPNPVLVVAAASSITQ